MNAKLKVKECYKNIKGRLHEQPQRKKKKKKKEREYGRNDMKNLKNVENLNNNKKWRYKKMLCRV